MSSIFGGSKSKQQSTQESGNLAYNQLNSTLSPTLGYIQSGAEGISRLLEGDASGFNAFKQATGFDAAAEAGSRGITGNAAASGLLRSGSTGKALQAYGNQIQNQYANQYLQQLLGLSNLGLGAAGTIAGAGQYSQGQSTGSSSNKPGLGKFFGGLASGIAASDRRLKENIQTVGKLPSGLNLYSYNYIGQTAPQVGVMADEVAVTAPEALGPVVDGYLTVNYDKLKELEYGN